VVAIRNRATSTSLRACSYRFRETIPASDKYITQARDSGLVNFRETRATLLVSVNTLAYFDGFDTPTGSDYV
jgi:hypothetical protein